MKQISIQNLGMIITNKCNLDCKHCLRGCKNNDEMTDDVIEATLDQIKIISNLCICGGEPTLGLVPLEKIFNSIIKKRIIVEEVSCVINGTIYSEKFLELLKYIKEYINYYDKYSHVSFNISYDKYHISKIEEKYSLEEYWHNVEKYDESGFFYGLQRLSNTKLFREGNAEKMNSKLTVPLRPIKTFITYAKDHKTEDRENGLCNIGPLVTINPSGIITECDASIINQEKLYNYGNVLNDSIEEVMLTRGEVIHPKQWLKMIKRETHRYNTYKK